MSQYGIAILPPTPPSTVWVLSVIDDSASPAYSASFSVRQQDLQPLATALNTAAGQVTPPLTPPSYTYVTGATSNALSEILSAPDGHAIIATV